MTDTHRTTDQRGPQEWDDYDDSFDEDWDGEGLDGDDDLSNCHGYFPDQGPQARFKCGAVGSEDCDECPMNNWLGLTNCQIDELEESDEH